VIVYCKTCLNPSTRPNTFFNGDGICPVCIYEKEKVEQKIDWDTRWEEIQEIKSWGRENTKSTHDCIVTVSGGKDSMRQAFFARDELGMNPLLVSVVYPPEMLHERGAHNISNLIENGFDCISITLDPIKYKSMLKHGFYEFGQHGKAPEMALYAIPVHVAIAYNIPLMFYGENPVLTIGERHGRLDGNAVEMQEGNTIKGGPKSLNYPDGNSQDFHFYEYPSYDDIHRAGIRIIYLGYYISDWYGKINADFAISKGLKIRSDTPENIGDLWGVSCLDDELRIVSQYLKYLKFGFGHVTDQVCELIQNGLIERNEAVELVKEYDGACDNKYIKIFCDYIGIDLDEFWRVVDKFVNKELFQKTKGEWKPIFEVH